MNIIIRLVEKIFIRLFLIATLVPLQSCSNTIIGEKLENSFDITEKPIISGNTIEVKNKQIERKKLKSIKMNDEKENENTTEQKSISIKNRFNQKSTKSIKKVIFNPQPYRIILKLSGANPSAPAESVTSALRKAGVQFEVEKIERYEDENFLKDSSFKRKEF